jgi:hypothetical protein
MLEDVPMPLQQQQPPQQGIQKIGQSVHALSSFVNFMFKVVTVVQEIMAEFNEAVSEKG